jgi:hypothetical protein
MSQNLYISKRSASNLKNPAEPAFRVDLPATFTNLQAAKTAARTTLLDHGYEDDFFPVFEIHHANDDGEWKRGDGVMLYAEGPNHEIFTVSIETVPNTIGFKGDDKGRVPRPLHHVLQTIIHYDEDKSGGKRTTVVEGTHIKRSAARAHAIKLLLDASVSKKDFAEYDEYTADDSPFGEDVIVHAVKSNGENILVSIVSEEKHPQ